jgi:mannose/fructose/N-acetylgalactosamine-specific phosphotransferase system component IIC
MGHFLNVCLDIAMMGMVALIGLGWCTIVVATIHCINTKQITTRRPKNDQEETEL